MDVDDEDPAWLEACMAAVDSLPVANLPSSANTSTSLSGIPGAVSFATGKCSGSSTAAHTNDNGGRRFLSSCASLPQTTCNVGAENAAAKSCCGKVGRASTQSAPPGHSSRGADEGAEHSGAGPKWSSSWTKGGSRRICGVGANVRMPLCVHPLTRALCVC